MARKELGPHALRIGQAVRLALAEVDDEVIVGCSGGPDSLALALATVWAAPRAGLSARAVVVDHGLQEDSAAVAGRVAALLGERGLPAEVRRVCVESSSSGLEAAARDARLACLARDGLPVLLGHTLDDQAETVLLGLLRGSGTRSLAGMAARRDRFLRPLLGVRRADTEAACREWGVEPWWDPHNAEARFSRVRARSHLTELSQALGRDVAPALARTAALARMDADYLERLANETIGDMRPGSALSVAEVAPLDDALRLRVVKRWLTLGGAGEVSMTHVLEVDALIVDWHGQAGVPVPGARVARVEGQLTILPTDVSEPPLTGTPPGTGIGVG